MSTRSRRDCWPRAHGGVLYVDEVNLLHDHLVDVLLDAAAMGRVHVERDGVSHSHDARFVLVGTMNPEEGELRPQLLDRFGLTVDVAASRDVDVRVRGDPPPAGVRGRPAGFAGRYADDDAELARRIAAARASVPDVVLPRHRIAPHRGAVRGLRRRRHARRPGGGAHRGRARRVARRRGTVAEEDIRVAAELALPHRRRRDPFDDPGLDPEQLDEAMARGRRVRPTSPNPSRSPSPTARWRWPESEPTGPDRRRPASAEPSESRTARPGSRPERSAVGDLPHQGAGGARRRRGRAGPALARPQPHRHRRCRPPTEPGPDTACTCSARCWRPRNARRAARDGRVLSAPDDVRGAHPRGPRGQPGDLRGRRVRVDGRARPDGRGQRRHAVAAARRLPAPRQGRGDHVPAAGRAELVLPPTSSVDIASRRLARFDTGGKTPLAQGLLAARDVVVREKVRDRARRSLVVVLTDGRATGGPDPLGRARVAAARLRRRGCRRGRGGLRDVVCATGFGRATWPTAAGGAVGAAGAALGRTADRLVKSGPDLEAAA